MIRLLLRLIAVVLMGLAAKNAASQVNTEVMRKTDLKNGVYNNLSFSLGYITGNSQILRIGSSYRTDLLWKRHYAFFIADYQRATSNERLSMNKGFAHLRYGYRFYKGVKGEIFTQKEFNEFILLKDRQLFGGGARFELSLIDTAINKKDQFIMNFGAGLMHETEIFNKTELKNTRFFRSTNYISAKLYLHEKVTATVIGYYQVHPGKTRDYRVLANSGLGFYITKNFIATTTFNLRYDNDPPLQLKKYDLEINNGVSLHF